MKELLGPGVVIIKYRNVVRTRNRTSKSFAPHYGQFSYLALAGSVWGVSFETLLKGGYDVNYTYAEYGRLSSLFLHGWTEAVAHRNSDWCNHVVPAGTVAPFLGGKFFNPFLRYQLNYKVVA